MTSDELPLSFSIVGTGRLGCHLGIELVEAGLEPVWILSRTGVSAMQLSKTLEARSNVVPRAGRFDQIQDRPQDRSRSQTQDRPEDQPRDRIYAGADVLILSVPDEEMAEVVATLAHEASLETDSDLLCPIVLHTSGALSSDVLSPLRAFGCAVGSMHPLQTFVEFDGENSGRSLFVDIPIALEGDTEAVEMGKRMATALGAKPFILSRESKVLYHAAAVFSSNFLTALLGATRELLKALPKDADLSIQLFRPLAEQALRNTFEKNPDEALTGPIARGDINVLRSHLSVLVESAPELVPVYISLARETIRQARSAGTLSEDTSASLVDLLESFVIL